MPKKNTTTRGGGQRNRAHGQKSIELVRPASALQEQEQEQLTTTDADEAPTTISTSTIEPETPVAQKQERSINENGNGVLTNTGTRSSTGVKAGRTRGAALVTPPAPVENEEVADEEETAVKVSPTPAAVTSAPKGSAAARIAARRQAAQKSQQRAAVSLITPEHYSYVRKDLRFILILAIIMFAVIIILHFVPGIGY
jgi:maltodextrin utilization protein YvdJ